MRDAAGHLPQRAQPLLLHHRLLRLAQVVVGSLQGVVELAWCAASATCSLSCRRNSHSPLLKLLASRRAAIRTPNTLPSTMSGAATSDRSPPRASRCGNGNGTALTSGS